MHRAHTAYARPEMDEAELLRRHGALIERVARRMARRTGMSGVYDDLWSVGALGLLEAARRFDPARDVRFESFAEHRIRGAMLDELRRMDHLPRRLRARTDAVSKGRQKLAQLLGREPTREELAADLKLELEELDALEELAAPQMQLPEEPTASEEPGPDETLDQRRRVGELTEAISLLPERLQLVVSLYYVEGLSYREIGQILQVSEPRVCQLHGDAMKKLRGRLGG